MPEKKYRVSAHVYLTSGLTVRSDFDEMTAEEIENELEAINASILDPNAVTYRFKNVVAKVEDVDAIKLYVEDEE